MKIALAFQCLSLHLVSVAMVTADPKPCCGPKQWEGVIFQQDGAYDRTKDTATFQNSLNKMSYDSEGRKVALTHQLMSHSSITDVFKIIEDFNQKTTWVIHDVTCVKTPLTSAMSPACVPDGATLLGGHVYGGVAGSTWSIQTGNITSRLTVSDDGCLPLTQSILNTGDVWNLSLLNFQNVTEGIKDPNVFKVPDFCQQDHRVPIFQQVGTFSKLTSKTRSGVPRAIAIYTLD